MREVIENAQNSSSTYDSSGANPQKAIANVKKECQGKIKLDNPSTFEHELKKFKTACSQQGLKNSWDFIRTLESCAVENSSAQSHMADFVRI
ncbi:unnamed protein product, partial [Amoebophrya sp. A25]|eukprot:GSA25T00019307001.1